MNIAFTIYCIIGVLISLTFTNAIYKTLNNKGHRGIGHFFGFQVIFWAIIVTWPYVSYRLLTHKR